MSPARLIFPLVLLTIGSLSAVCAQEATTPSPFAFAIEQELDKQDIGQSLDSIAIPVIRSTEPQVADEPAEVLPVSASFGGEVCDEAAQCNKPVACDECRCWRDGLLIFFGGEGFNSVTDGGDLNNWGFRSGFNFGAPISGTRMGLQFGASYAVYDLHGRNDNSTTSVEEHTVLTGGVYKRSNVRRDDRLSWALVYDHAIRDDYGNNGNAYLNELGQFRVWVGYALSARNEIAFYSSLRYFGLQETADVARGAGNVERVNTINQYNLVWHHNWELGGDTYAYLGAVENPGEFIVGLNGTAPLNNRWALFYGLHYIVPSTSGGDRTGQDRGGHAEEIWSVTGGLVFYPGRNAQSPDVSGHRSLPLLPVADNGVFTYDYRVP